MLYHFCGRMLDCLRWINDLNLLVEGQKGHDIAPCLLKKWKPEIVPDKCLKSIETLRNPYTHSRQLPAPTPSPWSWLGGFFRNHRFTVRHIFVPGKIFADANVLYKAAGSCENKPVCLWVSLVFIKITQPIKQVVSSAELPGFSIWITAQHALLGRFSSQAACWQILTLFSIAYVKCKGRSVESLGSKFSRVVTAGEGGTHCRNSLQGPGCDVWKERRDHSVYINTPSCDG